MPRQELKIPQIVLEWSTWHPWEHIRRDARNAGGVRIPNGRPGVYEVRRGHSQKRLTIGRSKDLRGRIRQGLVRGTTGHSEGEKIRKNENTSALFIRWAETDRPAAAEEDLQIRYKKTHGENPKYAKHSPR